MVWAEVANNLRLKGFEAMEGEVGTNKVWAQARSLEHTYKQYIDSCKNTGSEYKKPPRFFEEMDKLWGDKHNINPPKIYDSIVSPNVQPGTSSTGSDNQPKTLQNLNTSMSENDVTGNEAQPGTLQNLNTSIISESNVTVNEASSSSKKRKQNHQIDEFLKEMRLFRQSFENAQIKKEQGRQRRHEEKMKKIDELIKTKRGKKERERVVKMNKVSILPSKSFNCLFFFWFFIFL